MHIAPRNSRVFKKVTDDDCLLHIAYNSTRSGELPRDFVLLASKRQIQDSSGYELEYSMIPIIIHCTIDITLYVYICTQWPWYLHSRVQLSHLWRSTTTQWLHQSKCELLHIVCHVIESRPRPTDSKTWSREHASPIVACTPAKFKPKIECYYI